MTAFLVLAAALGFFLYTAAPVVTFVDSGEIAAVVATQGVAHPSGSPFYLLVASIVAALPFGSLIRRLNCLSAVLAALSVLATFLILLQTCRSRIEKGPRKAAIDAGKRPKKKQKPAEKRTPSKRPASPIELGLCLAGGVAGALAWMTNRALWETATVTEVYALYILLLTLVCFLLFSYSWHTSHDNLRSATRALAVASLLAGLGLSTYPPFGIIAPSVLLVLWFTEGNKLWGAWRRNLAMLSLVAVGLLPYVLLPLRAHSDPLLNWGDPSNWTRFWKHVSAEQYRIFVGRPKLEHLPAVLGIWWRQWPPIIWLLMVPGAMKMLRARSRLFAFTLVLAVTNLLYVMVYDTSDVASAPSDYYIYFLPLFWCSSLWIGWSMIWLIGTVRDWFFPENRFARTALLSLAVLPLLTAATAWHDLNRHRYTYADDFARGILNSAAPNALILAPDWNFASASLYLQIAEHVRTDVVVLDGELLRRSWYFRYVRKQAPWLYQNCGDNIEGFLRELAKYEEGRPYDPSTITEHFVVMINDFLATGIRTGHPPYILLNLQPKERNPDWYRSIEKQLGRPPYVTPGVPPHAIGYGFQWVPETVAFRLYLDSRLHPLPESHLPLRPVDPVDSNVAGILARYAEFWRSRGDYSRNIFHDCTRADAAYQRALQLSPGLQEALEGAAACR